MKFTYRAYEELICLLRTEKYNITDYYSYETLKDKDCVILRHDVDYAIDKAYQLAKLEAKLEVKSTYFVLLSGGFYNVAEKETYQKIQEINSMGHTIGLHFDEAKYVEKNEKKIKDYVEREGQILESILDLPIKVVSMHRPSDELLQSNYSFKKLRNSYGNTFFKEFKYLSDSRMHWREDVERVIKGHEHECLHILTHPFWYGEKEEGVDKKLQHFIEAASRDRYLYLKNNFENLEEQVEMDDRELQILGERWNVYSETDI